MCPRRTLQRGAEQVGEHVKEAGGGRGGRTRGPFTASEVIIRPLLPTWKFLRLT